MQLRQDELVNKHDEEDFQNLSYVQAMIENCPFKILIRLTSYA